MNASEEELAQVSDIGEVIAKNIYDFFREEKNIEEIKALLSKGVVIKEQVKKERGNTIFEGKKFVLTGTLTKYTRDQASEIIMSLGGETASSVSKNTGYVLAGENAGSKLAKAQTLGVKVISEEDFENMVKGKEE